MTDISGMETAIGIILGFLITWLIMIIKARYFR
jgi:hypothetical protein